MYTHTRIYVCSSTGFSLDWIVHIGWCSSRAQGIMSTFQCMMMMTQKESLMCSYMLISLSWIHSSFHHLPSTYIQIVSTLHTLHTYVCPQSQICPNTALLFLSSAKLSPSISTHYLLSFIILSAHPHGGRERRGPNQRVLWVSLFRQVNIYFQSHTILSPN